MVWAVVPLAVGVREAASRRKRSGGRVPERVGGADEETGSAEGIDSDGGIDSDEGGESTSRSARRDSVRVGSRVEPEVAGEAGESVAASGPARSAEVGVRWSSARQARVESSKTMAR